MNSSSLRPHVVTLGTAGGPRWWGAAGGTERAGIATAVVVGDAVYLVDCGQGTGGQLMKAGIPLSSLRGIFLTHLHSDHTIELPALTVFGFMNMKDPNQKPVKIIGPGNRGVLPPVSPAAETAPTPLFPENPTLGTSEMFSALMHAYSTDLADRMLDSLRPSPYRFFEPEDIDIPQGSGYHPNSNPTPEGMEPFEIYRDELVTVTATLVRHPPIAPAFAFRFETAEGSVTISGDTSPCANLVRLARRTDLLLHEAIDFDWVAQAYQDEEPSVAKATMEHHHKSHTSPEQAGQLASAAEAKALALHHLVPGNADASVWNSAESTFTGPVYVPDDLEVISFAHAAEILPAGKE